jgi:hypothetical protein
MGRTPINPATCSNATLCRANAASAGFFPWLRRLVSTRFFLSLSFLCSSLVPNFLRPYLAACLSKQRFVADYEQINQSAHARGVEKRNATHFYREV